jgi:hypothetical protein
LIELQEHALQLDEVLKQDSLKRVSISTFLEVFKALREQSGAHHRKDFRTL